MHLHGYKLKQMPSLCRFIQRRSAGIAARVSIVSYAVANMQQAKRCRIFSDILSPVRQLSVTLVRPTHAVEIFGNISTPLASVEIHGKFYGRRKIFRGSQRMPMA